MSSGSDVQTTAPVAAAITTTVASTTSEVPARPQEDPRRLGDLEPDRIDVAASQELAKADLAA